MTTITPTRLLPLLLTAVLLAAGCGGGTALTSGSSAAEVAGLVPADVALLLAVETDPDSEQWRQADDLLDKFPGRERLLDSLRDELADENLDLEDDILPALGDETYLAFPDFENGGDNLVVITQPRDRAKFDTLLEASDDPLVTREVDGWTLAAESEAVLDSFTAAGERLEDAGWFADAQERVEEDALLTLFLNGPAVYDALREAAPADCELPEDLGRLLYAAGSLSAEDTGVRFRLAAEGEGIKDFLRGESLLSHVPAGAFAFLGSPGFDPGAFPFVEQFRCGVESQGGPDLENELGLSYDALLDLFAGGVAFYVRSAAIIPEVTLLLAPEDEARAVATLDELAGKLAPFGVTAEPRRVGDVEAKALELGPLTVLYGAGDGKVVVSTSPAGFDALKPAGDALEDDEAFGAAREAAGVGEGDEVFVYLDLREVVQLVGVLAGFAQEDLPQELTENLEPLESFLAWGDLSDPNDVELGAFLGIG